MAGRNRRRHPHANAKHYQAPDRNYGSDHGRLGGADQSTEPDEVTCGNVVEAESVPGLEPGRDLAKFGRLPNGRDEPLPVLDTTRSTVAKSVRGGAGLFG